MIVEVTYQSSDLYRGKCSNCGEWTTTLVKGEGRCIDCIEDERFFDETMKIKQNEIRD
jgi:hypothetical protein